MRKINKALLLGELEKKYSLNNNREIEYEEYQELYSDTNILEVIDKCFENKKIVRYEDIIELTNNKTLISLIEDYLTEIEKMSIPKEKDNSKDYDYSDDDLVKMYFAEFKIQKNLTKEEENEIFALLNSYPKDSKEYEEVRNEIAEINIRLVPYYAKYYKGRGLSYIDLIGEGNIGLIQAIEKFDLEKNVKFNTFAKWWIRQAITRAIADTARTIRLPVHIGEKIYKYIQENDKLFQTLGREPSISELAEAMEEPEEKIRLYKYLCKEKASLDAPIGEDKEHTLITLIKDETADNPVEIVEGIITRENIDYLLDTTLSDRENNIIRKKYGLTEDNKEYTLEELGKEENVSKQRVEQIEKRALHKLDNNIKTKRLFKDDINNKNNNFSKKHRR